ncbi:hypothetical protein MRX96_046357 [Rhipicephalus microplus]
MVARKTTGTNEEEDAASSVTEAASVVTWPKGDPGARMQARARELQDEISSFCANSANRITPRSRGAARVLRGQLIDVRGEIAALLRQVMVAERPPVGDILEGLAVATAGGPAAVPAGPGVQGVTGTVTMGHPVSGDPGGVSYAAALGLGAISRVQGPSRNGPLGPQGAGAPGVGLRQDHVAFLTPVGSKKNPARDVARILKSNIDSVQGALETSPFDIRGTASPSFHT